MAKTKLPSMFDQRRHLCAQIAERARQALGPEEADAWLRREVSTWRWRATSRMHKSGAPRFVV
jgi:hypothetical protein